MTEPQVQLKTTAAAALLMLHLRGHLVMIRNAMVTGLPNTALERLNELMGDEGWAQLETATWRKLGPSLPGEDVSFLAELDFRPTSEQPKEEGDYLLYNTCDGYHVVEAWFGNEGAFEEFRAFAGPSFPFGTYVAWAKLPTGTKTMYATFEHLKKSQ